MLYSTSNIPYLPTVLTKFNLSKYLCLLNPVGPNYVCKVLCLLRNGTPFSPWCRIRIPKIRRILDPPQVGQLCTFADGLLEAQRQHLPEGGLCHRWRLGRSELLGVLGNAGNSYVTSNPMSGIDERLYKNVRYRYRFKKLRCPVRTYCVGQKERK